MKYAYYALVLIAGVWAQWIWSTYGVFWDLAPQLPLVLTVALASRERPVLAMTFAFVWGIFSDVMRIHLFGADALLLTCVAYAVGLVRRQIDVSSLVPQIALLGLISYAYFPALAVVGLIFERHSYWVGWKEFLLTPVFNCLVAPVIFLFVERFTDKHDL
jgi:rod shape-determining protein MreD